MVKAKTRKSDRSIKTLLANKKVVWPIAGVLVVVVVMLVLEITNTTHIFHKAPVPATLPVITNDSGSSGTESTPAATPNASKPAATTPAANNSKTPSTTGDSAPTADTNLTLVQPYGTFVSNHHPGNGNPTLEQSTCVTTVGASCYIKLVSVDSGKTTQLPTQTTGSDGSTSWNWDSTILTSGKWQVTAIATLGSQTKSASDTAQLEIP